MKMAFQEFFEQNGSQLLAGWLRARNDGNKEEFEHWVLGEYSVYMDVDKDMAELEDSDEDDDYEVPYHGIADSPAPAEALIWPKKVDETPDTNDGETKLYVFDVTLNGYGRTADEAWQDVTEGFCQDPGPTPDRSEYEIVKE